VACGAGFTAAWTDAGDAFLFGANAYGAATGRPFALVSAAARIDARGIAGGVESIALGFQHGVALARDGTLWAWGKNNNGQLGFGDRETASVPRLVPLPDAVVQVVSGLSHCAALTDCGDVWVWG
ncbi:regulator of chromosome condensation 1/beta-lactamase-inhibitor protein II, partial [Pelagophyceae sp. CCMP2097]